MPKKLLEIGPLEMEVMGLLGISGAENSVAAVRELLRVTGRDLAYTTVMTVLVRLHRKAQINRRKVGRQYLYSVPGKKALGLYSQVTESLFGAERIRPILGLLEEDFTIEELELLKKVIDQKLRR